MYKYVWVGEYDKYHESALKSHIDFKCKSQFTI